MANSKTVVTISAFTIAFALSGVGCGASNADDTVEALARNPERLKIVLRECRARIAKDGDPVDDPLCKAASEAWRRRFFGEPAMAKGKPAPIAPARKHDSAIAPQQKSADWAPRSAGS